LGTENSQSKSNKRQRPSVSCKNSKEGRASFNPELSIFDYSKLKTDWLCARVWEN